MVRIAGLREPRKRLGEWPDGLLERCRDKKGRSKVGVYGVVERDGYVQEGYTIFVEKGKGKALVAV